jgi:hypothetical protein
MTQLQATTHNHSTFWNKLPSPQWYPYVIDTSNQNVTCNIILYISTSCLIFSVQWTKSQPWHLKQPLWSYLLSSQLTILSSFHNTSCWQLSDWIIPSGKACLHDKNYVWQNLTHALSKRAQLLYMAARVPASLSFTHAPVYSSCHTRCENVIHLVKHSIPCYCVSMK